MGQRVSHAFGRGGIVAIASLALSIPRGSPASLPSLPLAAREEAGRAATGDLKELTRLEAYISDEKFQEVEPLLRTYLKTHPNSARACYDLGYVLFRTHRIRESVEALSKSLQLNIGDAEAHKILGLDLTMVGKYDEAQLELEEAARLKPNSAEIHYFLGRIHYTHNAFQLAKQEFEEAIRLDPSYAKAYDNLGLTMEGMGDDNAALASYEKAFELMARQGQKSEWPYINVCAMYNRRNEPVRALGYCQNATAINPKSVSAFFETAKAHMARGDWDAAAKALQRSVELNPRYPKFHYVLATVYRKLGKRTESEREMATFRELSAQSGVPPGQEAPEQPEHPANVRH
ncbi:MAG: tetratricopeptide repeat protein [Acidobacteriia bacterium]|nr:tetratricopeptide repeat protein [Terriglobia bacterium]